MSVESRVLVALAKCSDFTGRTAVPIRFVSDLTGDNRSAVSRAIDTLVKRGDIRVVDRTSKPCVYRVIWRDTDAVDQRFVPGGDGADDAANVSGAQVERVPARSEQGKKTLPSLQSVEAVNLAPPVITNISQDFLSKVTADYTPPEQVHVEKLTPEQMSVIDRKAAIHGNPPQATPHPKPIPLEPDYDAAFPAPPTQDQVNHLLALAGVQPDPQEPFYWRRSVHREALGRILKDRTFEDVCAAVEARANRPEARTIEAIVR